MVSIHGKFFIFLEKFRKNLRHFAFHNRSVFEAFFISIYAFEQLILVLSVFIIKNSKTLNLVVSIFAIIVLTTFAMHKLLMDSRIKWLENEVGELQQEKFILESRAIEANKMSLRLIDLAISEGLNKTKYSFKDKEVPK